MDLRFVGSAELLLLEHLMIYDAKHTDFDPQEAQEWAEATQAVVANEGRPRAHFLIDHLLDNDMGAHGDLHARVTTPYVNTISMQRQPYYPGDVGMEGRLGALHPMECNGDGATRESIQMMAGTLQPMSAAVLYKVRFNYFFP